MDIQKEGMQSQSSQSSSKSLWEKVNEKDRQTIAGQQPILKSQFRVKKSTNTSSIHIHLYTSIILFICASTPRAKISLGPSVHYQLEQDSNSLIIGKNEKTFQLRLDGYDNKLRWAEALTKLGIPQRNVAQEVPSDFAENYQIQPSNNEGSLAVAKAAPIEEDSESYHEKKGADMYAAPETFRPAMEHFIRTINYTNARRTCTDTRLFWKKGLERIPEEQDCCE